MAPKKRSRKEQRQARAASLLEANTRLEARRVAIRKLNSLVEEALPGVDKLDYKSFDNGAFERILRLLNRRCQTEPQRSQFREAVQEWVDNKGQLPGGLRLVTVAENNVSLEDINGDLAEEDDVASLVPGHRVLKACFSLKSKAFMLTHNSRLFTEAMWPEYAKWAEEVASKHGAKAWAACWELSLHAAGLETSTGKVYHGHTYYLWTDGVGVRMDSLDPLKFAGVRPRVDRCVTKTNNESPRLAALHGLWYVTVKKSGTIDAATNFKPYEHYLPLGTWLDSLWAKRKLEHGEYLTLSAEMRIGHSKRKREVADVVRQEREDAVHAHVRKEAEQQGELKDFCEYDLVDRFIAAHREKARRRPILVIIGSTNSGKSMLAGHVLLKLGKLWGLSDYEEITVEEDATLDFSNFDLTTQAGVVLDGVADAKIIKKHREALQGRTKVCKGGKSTTMMYAYPYALCRRGVIVTMDLSATNLDMFETDHWLSSEDNCLVLRLTRPAFAAEGQEADLTEPEDRAATLLSWSVGELARFLAKKDMEGPAQQLRTQGVAGEDFSAMTEQVLQKELHFSTFTSRKLIKIRDTYLAQDR